MLNELSINKPIKIWNFTKYISNFNPNKIKIGDKILIKDLPEPAEIIDIFSDAGNLVFDLKTQFEFQKFKLSSNYFINLNNHNNKNVMINETKHIIFKVDVLIKTTSDINKVFVYNSIRGLPGVVVVTVEQNDYLDTQSTDSYEYSLLHIKYMVTSTPEKDINIIKHKSLLSRDKIDGLLQFLPRLQTIRRVGEY